MILKSSLGVYRRGKRSFDVQSLLYGNRRGNVLLALARAGLVPTKSDRKYEDPQQDRTCGKCGMYEETVRHVIFGSNDAHCTDEDFLSRLSLQEEMKDPSLVQKTRVIQEIWEKETSDLLQAPGEEG